MRYQTRSSSYKEKCIVLVVIVLIVLIVLFGPSLWVSYVLRKYSRDPETNFPGTGGELARHLLDRFDLHDVKVVVTESGDHYSPIDRSVALTQDRYDGKTLAAIVIAAHECGHAIQHARREPFFLLRHRLARSAQGAQIIGSALLAASPLIGGLAVSPHLSLVSLAGAFMVLGYGVVVQLATLPVEFDASFKKALPLLSTGYLSEHQLAPSKTILRAAALTYVAGTLLQLFNFWRWITVLRR